MKRIFIDVILIYILMDYETLVLESCINDREIIVIFFKQIYH